MERLKDFMGKIYDIHLDISTLSGFDTTIVLKKEKVQRVNSLDPNEYLTIVPGKKAVLFGGFGLNYYQ